MVLVFTAAGSGGQAQKPNELNKPLLQAGADGDIDKVKSLLSRGADLNARDWEGTALHTAAQHGQKPVVQLLIAAGADVNIRNKQGRTALDLAEQRGHTEVVRLLRMPGAKDKSALEHDGKTPARSLHEAAKKGDIEQVRLHITQGTDVSARDNQARTPLSLAEEKGYAEIAELLRRHTRIPSPAEAPFVDTTPDMILTPEASPPPQQFGCYVDCGDVNGDGYDDCLVTAAHYNNYQGRVYLYYGGPDMDARPDKVFTGEAGQLFGEGAALGDVNGDHCADVIIAALRYNNKQGRAYIYYGGPNMDTVPDLTLEGEPGTSGTFGRVIDTADIDRDGYADVVINALRYGSDAGRAYLYYGGNPMDRVPAKTFDGENPGDMFGRDMDMGGDVNGDGYGDIIFGCRAWNNVRGRAYLYYGGPRDSMDSNCDKIFTGESRGDEFGSSVCVFDVDRDGYADVMIGARKYTKYTPRSYEGRMYMYWGNSDMGPNPDLIFEGERGVGACFGGDSIECGYFNDDKYPDIVVSAWGYRSGQGRVYLYYGGPRASMDRVCDHTFTGEMGTDGNMYGVRNAVGDFNGDKRSDLLVGAPWYTSGSRLGRAYVYYTKPFPPARQQKPAESAQHVSESHEAQPK